MLARLSFILNAAIVVIAVAIGVLAAPADVSEWQPAPEMQVTRSAA